MCFPVNLYLIAKLASRSLIFKIVSFHLQFWMNILVRIQVKLLYKIKRTKKYSDPILICHSLRVLVYMIEIWFICYVSHLPVLESCWWRHGPYKRIDSSTGEIRDPNLWPVAIFLRTWACWVSWELGVNEEFATIFLCFASEPFGLKGDCLWSDVKTFFSPTFSRVCYLRALHSN